MDDPFELAEKLCRVERARERFLAMWAVECFLDQPEALDRAVADVQRVGETGATSDDPALSGRRALDD